MSPCPFVRSRRPTRRVILACTVAVLAPAVLLLGGCDSNDGAGPIGPAGTILTAELQAVAPLDPVSEGEYRVWVVDAAGVAHDAGTLDPRASSPPQFEAPAANGVAVEITVAPPEGRAAGAVRQVLLRGGFRDGVASLSVVGALTAGALALRERPGQFTMFTPSNNHVGGYPSEEESGIWLFNMAPRETEQNDMWVRLTPLAPGWVYEGWMVRDIGTASAIWLSYGKFLPDASGAVNRRDDTGWGPFSGVLDFLTAGEEEFPGDDWISNPLFYPWPSVLPLPLDLREKRDDGSLRWTHVITIEPASDRGEPIGSERPFPLMLYRDLFGDAGPGTPRPITFDATRVPAGTVRAR
jgi:hypothetical protein